MLNRPQLGKNEYVGDIDGMIANFLRAVKYAPAEVAKHADYPPSSIDLQARNRWLDARRQSLCSELVADPLYFDARCAGWYAWQQSVRISNHGNALTLGHPAGMCRKTDNPHYYLAHLAERLKHVTIYYGDWSGLAHAALRESRSSDVAIFFDPPYTYKAGHAKVYVHDSTTVGLYVQRWALVAASPRLRIALCGYEGEYDMPPDWVELPWRSQLGGLRERVWFSPDCE